MTRFSKLDEADMNDAQRAVAKTIASGPRGAVRGPFKVLLHNPELALRLQAVGEYLRYSTGLDDSLVELAILVTARHWSCQYEWVAHAAMARKAQLPEPIVESIADGRIPQNMDAKQTLVYRFVQRVLKHGEAGDDYFAQGREAFGEAGVLSLLSICGYYSLLAMVLNTAQIELPDNVAPPLAPLNTKSPSTNAVPGAQ